MGLNQKGKQQKKNPKECLFLLLQFPDRISKLQTYFYNLHIIT